MFDYRLFGKTDVERAFSKMRQMLRRRPPKKSTQLYRIFRGEEDNIGRIVWQVVLLCLFINEALGYFKSARSVVWQLFDPSRHILRLESVPLIKHWQRTWKLIDVLNKWTKVTARCSGRDFVVWKTTHCKICTHLSLKHLFLFGYCHLRNYFTICWYTVHQARFARGWENLALMAFRDGRSLHGVGRRVISTATLATV